MSIIYIASIFSLDDSYKEQIPLAAIVYLHRISDNRMAASPLRNLQMFASLCGQEMMPHVVLGTTMWSEINLVTGERREQQLLNNYWLDMTEGGCCVARFEDSYESAWDIVGALVTRKYAMLPREIVDGKKSLGETAAGLKYNDQLERLIADHKEAARRLHQQNMKTLEHNF